MTETYRPGDADYTAATTGYQLAWAHRPDTVVEPATTAELAAVAAAPVTVQNTGHGRTTPAEGGVLVSTRRLTGVVVDPVARTARVEAGARWGAVVAAAAEHGLAPLSGSSPDVGVVGYVLGSGLGLLGRRYGWAGDHARVTGRVGDVITEMEVDLFPVPSVFVASLAFDTALIPDVLGAFRAWTGTVPDALTSSVAVVPIPDLDAVPPPIRGRRIAQVRVVYAGEVADGDPLDEAALAAAGERWIAPLREIGPRLLERSGVVPFAEAASIYNDPADAHAYLGTNTMVDALDDAVVAAIDAVPATVVQVNHLGGALSGPGRYLVRLLSALDWGGEDAIRAAHGAVLDAARPRAVGQLPGFVFGPPAPVDATRS